MNAPPFDCLSKITRTTETHTFKASTLLESVDVCGSQSSPYVVGKGEREAVGRVEGQRSGEGFGHSILDDDGLCIEKTQAALTTALVSVLKEDFGGRGWIERNSGNKLKLV